VIGHGSAARNLDQIVGQPARLGWTIGVTADNLVGAQCRAVVGLGNAKTLLPFLSGKGRWVRR